MVTVCQQGPLIDANPPLGTSMPTVEGFPGMTAIGFEDSGISALGCSILLLVAIVG